MFGILFIFFFVFFVLSLFAHRVEPQYNEVPRDLKYVRYKEASLYRGSFHIFYYYWVKKIVRFTKDFAIQWNLYSGDTLGTKASVT